MLCNQSALEMFLLLPKETSNTLAGTLYFTSTSQSLETTILSSISMDLNIPHISHKWNRKLCGLSVSVFFHKQQVFKVHLSPNMYFILF